MSVLIAIERTRCSSLICKEPQPVTQRVIGNTLILAFEEQCPNCGRHFEKVSPKITVAIDSDLEKGWR